MCTALVVWGGVLAPGAAEVADLIGLATAIADADVVVTGEGSYDGQSGDGKVPSFLAGLAADAGADAILAAGRITADADISLFSAAASLTNFAGSSDAALADPARWLRAASAALAESMSSWTPAKSRQCLLIAVACVVQGRTRTAFRGRRSSRLGTRNT